MLPHFRIKFRTHKVTPILWQDTSAHDFNQFDYFPMILFIPIGIFFPFPLSKSLDYFVWYIFFLEMNFMKPHCSIQCFLIDYYLPQLNSEFNMFLRNLLFTYHECSFFFNCSSLTNYWKIWTKVNFCNRFVKHAQELSQFENFWKASVDTHY